MSCTCRSRSFVVVCNSSSCRMIVNCYHRIVLVVVVVVVSLVTSVLVVVVVVVAVAHVAVVWLLY